MKKKETIIINSERFTIENATFSYNPTFKTLDMCYEKPSTTKMAIYEDWCDWFRSIGCDWDKFGVVSHNCMQFSMGGFIDLNGITYYAYITKSYNRLYKVV